MGHVGINMGPVGTNMGLLMTNTGLGPLRDVIMRSKCSDNVKFVIYNLKYFIKGVTCLDFNVH